MTELAAAPDADAVAAPLTRLLLAFVADLEGRGSIATRLVVVMRSSKGAYASTLLWLVMIGSDIVLTDSAAARRAPIQMFLGIYSCAWVIWFYRTHSRSASRTLASLAAVSRELEFYGTDTTKEQLSARARHLLRVARFYSFFSLTQLIGGSPAALGMGSIVVAHVLPGVPYGQPVDALLELTHLVPLYCSIIAYYSMLGLLFTMFGSCTTLFRALGAESARAPAGDRVSVARMAGLHARLLRAACRTRRLFATLSVHTVTAQLVLPLLGTVELLVAPKKADSLTVVTFAHVFIVFIPICMAGQALEDASTALRSCLYAGPWLEEAAAARRDRACLMLGAGLRAHVAVGRIGSLNASTCLRVVNRWFSFLNVFINTQASV